VTILVHLEWGFEQREKNWDVVRTLADFCVVLLYNIHDLPCC
jgi:hypothetical protein